MMEYLGIPLFLSKNTNGEIFKSILYSNEFWKDIYGYEGLYKISTLGRVFSIKRRSPTGRIVGGHIKSTPLGGSKKYKICTLHKDKVRKSKEVHRLLMETFDLKNKNECINHKNGNRMHNWISNLEWCSYSHNNRHAYQLGLKPPVITKKKLNWIKSKKIIELSKTMSKKELALTFGCSVSCISEILSGETWNIEKRKGSYKPKKGYKKHSKYKGVGIGKGGKWRSRIFFDGKEINLGVFSSEKAAALAYNEKSIELFGEYAFTNKIIDE